MSSCFEAEPAFAREVAERASVVLNFAGPFDALGRALATACAEAGTDYVDVSGEPHFVAWSRASLHPMARETGARILHAVATESLPAMLLAAEHRNARHIEVQYRMHLPLMSPGSRTTAALAGTVDPVWARGGELVPVPEAERRRPCGDEFWLVTPYPEVVLIPTFAAGDVDSWLKIRSWVGGSPATEEQIWTRHRERRRPGPPETLRRKTRVSVRVIAEGEVSEAEVVDSYAFTAAAAVIVARYLEKNPGPGGVIAVPDAIPAPVLWASLADHGLSRASLPPAPP